MKFVLSLLFIIPQLFAVIDTVMYGEFITIKQAPYFVSALLPWHHLNIRNCGGAIISEYWIITAAHCTGPLLGRINAGESIPNMENSTLTYDIEKIFVHASFVPIPREIINDIALIKLKDPIEFDEYRQPIKIRKIPPRENDTVVAVGFGHQGDGKGAAPVLKKTEVTVVSEAICNNYTYGFVGLRNEVFCAGNGTTDVCEGDSGGPAVIDGELAGLVSYGPWCMNYKKHTREPGVYARVDTLYDWIFKITGIVY